MALSSPVTTATADAAAPTKPAVAASERHPSTLSLYVQALRDGHAAARLHHELQRSGVSSAEAAARALSL